jgi:membrane protease YdiL (CAAX protease family)
MLLTGHRPVRRSRHRPPLPAVLWTVGAATAEELLWRVIAPAAGQAVGWHRAAATAAALCGFLLLHVPKFGFRRLPYLMVAGLLFTGCALAGGLLAAATAHMSHNLVIDLSATTARRHADQAPIAGLTR